MKMKFLACCVLFGLTACGEKPQEQSQMPTQTEVKQEQSQTVESKPVEEPKIYADEAKKLRNYDYVRYDITQIVPYFSVEQSQLFVDVLRKMVSEEQTALKLKECPNNSFYQTAHGIYLQNMGNYQEAKHYYEMAAEKGNAYAENRLGELYLLGLGIERDVEKARYWFERSANTGYFFAESALGVSYLDIDVKILRDVNYETGGLWFSNEFLARGRIGKNADIQKAQYWLTRATMQGDRVSEGILSNFNLNYQPIEIQENLVDVKIDGPACSQTKTRPLIIIKENLPQRYRSKQPEVNNYRSRRWDNEIFLGDKVVTRAYTPPKPTIGELEFIVLSEKSIHIESDTQTK